MLKKFVKMLWLIKKNAVRSLIFISLYINEKKNRENVGGIKKEKNRSAYLIHEWFSSVKVSKEAQAAVAKAASVFVLYATSCANNVALKSNR